MSRREYSNANQSDNNDIFLFSLNNHNSTREEFDVNPTSQDKLSIDVRQMESIVNEDPTEQYAIENEITPAKEKIRCQQRADIELLHKISYLKEKIIPDSKKEAARLLDDINRYLSTSTIPINRTKNLGTRKYMRIKIA